MIIKNIRFKMKKKKKSKKEALGGVYLERIEYTTARTKDKLH
jgi:hypothetical protein